RVPFGDGPEVGPREPGRILLTRNHALAAKSEPAFLLRSPEVRHQLREVHERFPSAPFEPQFDRCPECNAPLRPWSPPVDGAAWPEELPVALVRSGLAVAECPACQRHFWEGSHAQRIRAVIAEAIAPEATR
ncbi:MAG: Mut7-C RNAse domain-containing protein, partial [Thermoplasmata archaeon]|nr:Mut7-C RNAse domain-containing protein [Thermoplasmata archaeon]